MKKQLTIAGLSIGAILLLATVASAEPFGNSQNVAERYGNHMSSHSLVASNFRGAETTGRTSNIGVCAPGMNEKIVMSWDEPVKDGNHVYR